MSVAICPGPPPTAMPTPAPTKGHRRLATPTPQCTPTAEASIAGLSAPDNTVQFNVQGTYQTSTNSKKKLFCDRTSDLSLRWNTQPAGLATSGVVPGEFVGVSPGCVCLTAEIAPGDQLPGQRVDCDDRMHAVSDAFAVQPMSGTNADFDPDEDAESDAHGIAQPPAKWRLPMLSAVAPVYNWFAALPCRFDSLHP